MSNKNKALLVPKLRFPEFRQTGGWIPKRLKDACEVNPANSALPERFVYIDLESVEAGKLTARKTITRDEAPSRAQRLLHSDDVIFQIVRPYQRNNFHFKGSEGLDYVASTGYAQLRAKDAADFLFQAVHVDGFVDRVIAKCTGSSYPAINSSDLAEVPLAIPKPDEQKKIADCLSSLDEMIAAQARKVDALKTHKMGLMQKFFPREGETQPRLRFPEFRDAGEWTPTTLGSIASFSSGGTPSKDNPEYWNGNIPWVSASSMYEFHVSKADHYVTPLAIGNGTRIAKKGTLLILVRGSMLFKRVPMCVAAVDVAFNQDVKALKVAPSVDGIFLIYQLLTNEARIPINKTGIGAGKIELADLKEFGLFVPSKLEQRHIAACLSNLDDLVAAASQELETLKTHKKGLMQQLFPSAEAVEA